MMRISILIEAIIFICFLFVATKTNAFEKGVFFNELAVCGSSISTSDEWIELINTNTEEIELTGWRIVAVDKDQLKKEMIVVDKGLIKPGGLFIISNNSQDYEFSKGKSTLAIDPDVIESSLSLANENIILELYNGQNELMDVFGNGEKNFIKPCATKKATFQRADYNASGSNPSAWELSKTQKNLDENIEDLGTPGFQPIFRDVLIRDEFFKEDLCKISFIEKKMPYSQDYDFKVVTAQQENQIKEIKLDKEDLSLDLSPYESGIINLSIDYYLNNNVIFSFSNKVQILESSGDLIISEVMPNPSDESEEWIELYNRSGKKIYLNGWFITDGSQKIYRFNDLFLESGNYFVLPKSLSKITLNNSSEKIMLYSPNKVLVDKLEIPSSSNYQDKSYGLIKGAWKWLDISTPGQSNLDNIAVQAPEEIKEKPPVKVQDIDIKDEPKKELNKIQIKEKPAKIILASSVIDKSRKIKVLSEVETNYHKRDFKFKPNMIYFFSINFLICLIFIYEIYRPKPPRISRQNL